jgi:uncharacterized DUF497 family protein
MGLPEGRSNHAKHGVSFEEAATLFADPDALEWEDPSHSKDEERMKRLGYSASGRILVLVYTRRRTSNDEETIRIISARRASAKERKAYFG